jgi:hypothetical protein
VVAVGRWAARREGLIFAAMGSTEAGVGGVIGSKGKQVESYSRAALPESGLSF